MDELNKSHVDDVEHDIEASFSKVISLPVYTDGKDSGVCVYIGLTNIGRYAIGHVRDTRLVDIANRISLAGQCLSPPKGLHSAPHDGKAVHGHDDGTWWFWDETWATEHGPFLSEKMADDAVAEYARSL